MTAPQHAASRRWLTEVLDWLLDLIASLASRIAAMTPAPLTPVQAPRPGDPPLCDGEVRAGATPQNPGTVPPPVPAAPAAPLAGAEALVPEPPSPGAGASPRRDTWVIRHEPPGSVITGPGGTVFAHRAWLRTPTAPNPALDGPGTVPLRAVDVALVRPYVLGSAAWWIGTGILGAS